MSPDLFKKKVFPMLDNGDKVFFILIDNFRLDQWREVKDLLAEYLRSTKACTTASFRPPHSMPQLDLLRADALADRKDVSGTLGGRGQRGREKPE